MRSLILLVAVFIFSSYSLLAQVLTGRIIDEGGRDVPYASIAVFNDSTLLSLLTADSCGVFSVNVPNAINPRLRVSMIGYETIDTIIYNSHEPATLTLKSSSVILDEIEVRHNPPAVTMKGDVLVANVLGTALQHVGTAKDVLRHVPLISFGSDDAIEVFGRGAPAVYINGRRVTDMRELNQLRSENIKSIDVITNPGSAYSADIMTVVRIRTIKQRGEGFSGLIGWSDTYDKHFADAVDLNLRYRNNNLEIFAEGSLSDGKHAYITGNDQWSTESTGDILRQNALSERLADMRWGAVKVGGSYSITQDHSIGAFYNYSYWRKYESLDNVQDISLNGHQTERWLMNGIDTTLSAPTHNVNVYYNGSVSDFQIDLNVDWFERNNDHNFFFVEQNSSGNHDDIFIKNFGKSRMFAERFVMEYRKGGMFIEAGEEFTVSNLSSTSKNIGAPFVGSDTRVNERNFAPFINIFHSWRNFRVGIGVRYDYTVNDFEVRSAEQRGRKLKYSRLYPAASISWSHADASASLSFTNKSVRPSYSQLSDILEYSTRSKYWRGNPELDSEQFYNFQFSGAWKYFFGMVMFTHTRDAIFQTYEPYEDDPEVSLITYRNIPTLNSLNSTLGFRYKVGWWSPTVTLSMAKQWHELFTVNGQRNLSHPTVRVRYDNTFNFPQNWITMLSFDLTGAGDYHNQANRSRHSLDASVIKTFFEGDMTVSVAATDLLNRSYLRYSIYNEVGKITCLDTWPSRSFRLSVRYSFNTAASRYKGSGAGVNEKSRM